MSDQKVIVNRDNWNWFVLQKHIEVVTKGQEQNNEQDTNDQEHSSERDSDG